MLTYEKFMRDYPEILYVISLVILIALSFTVITADKTPKNYYLGASYHTPGFCVYSNQEWWLDEAVFCTDDINKAISVMKSIK